MQICIFLIYDHNFFAVAYVCKRTPAPEIALKIIGLRVKLPEIVQENIKKRSCKLQYLKRFWREELT